MRVPLSWIGRHRQADGAHAPPLRADGSKRGRDKSRTPQVALADAQFEMVKEMHADAKTAGDDNQRLLY